MYLHPITKEKIEFNTMEDLMDFLQKCNPSMMRSMVVQYKEKYPNYEIIGFDKEIIIRKIKEKKWQKKIL